VVIRCDWESFLRDLLKETSPLFDAMMSPLADE
jgi:hypothetical protein